MPRMYEVAVESDGENVRIKQPGGEDIGDCIILAPEQIPVLIRWLQEASDDCRKTGVTCVEQSPRLESALLPRKPRTTL